MSMEDINAVVKRWRANVKNKFRGIASFDERAAMRFDVIKAHFHPQRRTMDHWKIRQAVYRGPNDYQYTDRRWRPIRVGQTWGGEDITAFFRQKIVVPREFAGMPVALQIFVGGDSLVKVNGQPYHGLDLFRSEVPLATRARAGQVFDIEIESYMNFQGTSPKINELIASDLVTIDRAVRDAYWDLWCAAKMLTIPNLDSKVQEFIEHHLWEAMKQVPLQEKDPGRFRTCVLTAQKMVRETIYASKQFHGQGRMHLVGHSHLDVVFCWPYREFIRKVGRTHATMLRLMEEFPQFKFSQSQAKIYADMKTYYPALFKQVRRRFAQGRWEPIGAFWVEPDCNLISGESFVRQILHGQRFLKENFGMTSRTCWQPDVFGLSWAMPQILARSGVRYFLTNKMVPWNDTNPWTINTFWWEGFDGSRVLGVVPPGHFMGTVDPDVIDKQWRNFSDQSEIGETLHIYGWGDGGGGVDPEMLESAKRYLDMPGLVKMQFSTTEEALDRIASKARTARLPVLRDEIYLEAHRGTYTHRGILKKLNRRGELLYREAELLATLAWTRTDRYPEKELDAGWKDLLTSQFHDSLPGTHVPKVFPELLQDWARINAAGERIRTNALRALTGPAAGKSDALIAFNSMLFPRAGYASIAATRIGDAQVADGTGQPLPQQKVRSLEGDHSVLFQLPEVPPLGFRVLPLVRSRRATRRSPALRVTPTTLENEFIRATFRHGGELVSLRDKEQNREILPPGSHGNQFQMFEDTPGKYDAWDIVETYRDHPIDISGNARLSIDERGPLRVSLRLEKRIAGSTIVQRIALCAGTRHLDFETSVNWSERQRLLKVAFPVDINATFATYDIAFGNMPRANHTNTPTDRARFEVPAHQWMDLSQSDYGVSILNDCKYGCDVHGKVMRLTLLKGSIHPDPKADVGMHYFTYSVFPHPGDWRTGQTIRHALELNHAVLLAPVTARRVRIRDGHSLMHCTAPQLTLEAVKRSEDGRSVIVRLVERHNAATRAELVFDRPVRRAWSCDLMERKEQKLRVVENRVIFSARPYEILTLRVDLK